MDKEKETPTPETVVEASLDAAAIAKIVADVVKTEAPKIVDEAIKPLVEKSEEYKEYADAIVELERKKIELETPKAKKGSLFARYARAMAMSKGGDYSRTASECLANGWDENDPVIKALQAGTPSGGGSLIPAAVSAEFIDVLRAVATVRSIAQAIPMPSGNLTIRRLTVSATSSYVGESTNVTSSDQVTGNIDLNFKKLVTLTPVSNSLLRYSGGLADDMVRNDLLRSQALREDTAFLTGNGESNTPRGLLTLLHADHVNADTGATAAQIMNDLANAVGLVEGANVMLGENETKWLLNPSDFWEIFGQDGANSEGTYPFRFELSQSPPRLLGFEVKKTTQVGADAYLVHGPSLLLADSMSVAVESFDGAAYYDGSSVVSGASRDETVIRAISEHDFNIRHNKAGAVITTVATA